MAIAFDAQASGSTNPGSSLSFNHTCTGSNLLLFLGFQVGGSNNTPTVTYNSVTMTQLSAQSLGGSDHLYLYYLIAPSTGTNSVSIDVTGASALFGFSASYTGCQQSGVPDAHNENTGASPTLATAVTSIADNCWFVIVTTNNGGDAVTSFTNGVKRTPGSVPRCIGDSNTAQTPAGQYTLTTTLGFSGDTIWNNMASFAPAAGGGGAVAATHFLPLMGVGT